MTGTLRRLAAAALLAGCASAPRAADVTAFVGVSVVPMSGADAMLSDRTVLVQGDRIVAIGPADQLRVPAGARRIDGAGRYLIPGLADMHVHLEYFEEPDVLKLFLANGVTTVRNMDGRDYILEWRRAVAAGALVGPTIHTAGPLLDGDPPILPDNTVVADAAQARAHVHAQADAGYDFIKVYTNLPADAYRAVVSAAAERGLPVVGHVPRRVDLAEALAGGLAAVEHLADYGDWIEADDSPFRDGWHWSKLYVAMPVDDTKLAAAAARIAASGVWTVPTMVQANRALAPPDTVAAWLASPAIAPVPPAGRALWERRVLSTAARMDADDWARVRRGRTNRERLVRALHHAGAGLLIGTDTPNPFVVPGYSLVEELQNFVRAGVPPHEALAAATSEAARFFGELDEWGTIQPGRRADLVLLHADPLADIGNVARPAGVMVRGSWFTQAELQGMITEAMLR